MSRCQRCGMENGHRQECKDFVKPVEQKEEEVEIETVTKPVAEKKEEAPVEQEEVEHKPVHRGHLKETPKKAQPKPEVKKKKK